MINSYSLKEKRKFLYKKIYSFGIIVFTMIICSNFSSAQGTDCASATSLSVNSTCVNQTFSVSNGNSGNGGAASCAGNINDDAWYTFTATSSGTAADINGSNNEIAVVIYSGTCGALTEIGCGSGVSDAVAVANTISGNTYFVRIIRTVNGGGSTSGNICLRNFNDGPCDAIPINVGSSCSYSTYTNLGSTASGIPEPGCGISVFASGVDEDVWFTATVPSNGVIILEGNSVSFTNGAMAVYTGTCNSLSLLDCDDNSGPGSMPSLTLTGLLPGSTIYIRFWEYSGNNSLIGDFELCAYTPPAPLNDEPCNAIGVPVNTNCTYTNYNFEYGSLSLAPSPGCGSAIVTDVWYSAVVPASGELGITTNYAGTGDIDMAVYQGSCSSLSLISCSDDDMGNFSLPGFDLTGLSPGSTVLICVWSPDPVNSFDMCLFDPSTIGVPLNDECSGAIAITYGTSCSPLFGSLYGSTQTAYDYGCSLMGGADVWYSFVASATGAVEVSFPTINPSASLSIAIYDVGSANCGGTNPNSLGSPVFCDASVDATPVDVLGLTPGNTYFVRISMNENIIFGPVDFDFCVVEVGPCGNPENQDYCSNPAILTQGPGTFSSSTSGIYSGDAPGNLTTTTGGSFLGGNVFCGSLENNSWYEFTAISTTEVFNFTVSNCDGSIQAAVYEITDDANGCCGNFTQMSNCWDPADDGGSLTSGAVTASGLTIGETYMLLVDGFGGDVCDFSVTDWTATGILPVELIDFSGVVLSDRNELRWQTASEHDNDYFEILRSENGIDYELVGVVDAVGESQTLVSYTYTDFFTRLGIVYYRLRQVDINGVDSEHYDIAIKKVLVEHQEIHVWPNPFKNVVYVSLQKNSKGTIFVKDLQGITVQELAVNNYSDHIKTIELTTLNSGIYILEFVSSTGNSIIKKIIKT
jgi:hypothetical protein